MKKEYEKRVEIFNKRLEILYEQICKWLEEEQIEYVKETDEMALTKDKGKTFTSKRLDIYTTDGDTLFSVVPYGVRIVGAEGRIEIEGDSGSESLVYVAENGSPEAAKKEGEKEYIISNPRISHPINCDDYIVNVFYFFKDFFFLVFPHRLWAISTFTYKQRYLPSLSI